jgi:hypothetical protein
MLKKFIDQLTCEHSYWVFIHEEKSVMTEPWSSETGVEWYYRTITVCGICKKVLKKGRWILRRQINYGGCIYQEAIGDQNV